MCGGACGHQGLRSQRLQRDRLCYFFGKVNHGKENQYSGLTNVPKLRIIEQVIGFRRYIEYSNLKKCNIIVKTGLTSGKLRGILFERVKNTAQQAEYPLSPYGAGW